MSIWGLRPMKELLGMEEGIVGILDLEAKIKETDMVRIEV